MNARLAMLSLLVIVLHLSTSACTPSVEVPSLDWPAYRGGPGSTNFAALDQINASNVAQLTPAWAYKTGDSLQYTIECNPLVIDGVLYGTSPRLKAFALDAATGEEIWTFDPAALGINPWRGQTVNRGFAYWADGADRRLYYVVSGRLYALNADTGELVSSFGEKGSIDFGAGLDREFGDRAVGASSPGVVFEDLLIMGSATGDGIPQVSPPPPPGHIRAFDVRTGERVWIFHTIPHPGEYGYETWPEEAWKTAGGTNSWSGLSLDVERGIVFAPIGSPTNDHVGYDRIGQNLFGNSVLALDARTGERVWHFQAVHHDLWDYDLPAAPSLVTSTQNGITRDAVAQITKMGHLFVLDRATGEPVFPVEERPVPQSTLPGESSWPTQPFPPPSLAYAKQGFSENDITDLNPEAEAYIREMYWDKFGPSVLFQPPSRNGAIYMPQFNGGTDWGGAAFNPATEVLFVNASNDAESMEMLPAPADAKHTYDWVMSGHDEITDPEGFPISKRPWGTMNAIDLNEGRIIWQVPLGTYPELEARGLPPTGTFNIGGPLATAGGVVFIGATRDERFRAFDQATGEVLWEYQLPAAGYATPAAYMVNGKQYVVIAAGGGGKGGTKTGDSYIAFALP